MEIFKSDFCETNRKMRYVLSCPSLYRKLPSRTLYSASNANRTKEVGESVQKEAKEEKTEEVAGVAGVRGARKCECVRACMRARIEGKRTTERPVPGRAERREKERKRSVR